MKLSLAVNDGKRLLSGYDTIRYDTIRYDTTTMKGPFFFQIGITNEILAYGTIRYDGQSFLNGRKEGRVDPRMWHETMAYFPMLQKAKAVCIVACLVPKQLFFFYTESGVCGTCTSSRHGPLLKVFFFNVCALERTRVSIT